MEEETGGQRREERAESRARASRYVAAAGLRLALRSDEGGSGRGL
jgi:hypothetical protein